MKKTNLIILLFSLLVASCGEHQKGTNLFVYDTSDDFMNSLGAEIKESFKLDNIEIKVHNANRKQSLQNSQIVKAIDNNKGEPFILNIVDRLSASVIIEKAKREDTPILFVNREPLMSDAESSSWEKENIYYVGSDSKYQGIAQAEIAAEYFNYASNFANSNFDKNKDGKLQVVLLKGELSHQDAEARTKYVFDGLRNYGFDVDILEIAFCDWDQKKGYEEMQKMFNNELNIELLISNNDAMAIGAINYLKTIMVGEENFIEQFFPIIGVDGTRDGLKAISEGYMLGTVYNDEVVQANLLKSLYLNIVEQEVSINLDENITKNGNFYYVKGEKITKDTILKYLT